MPYFPGKNHAKHWRSAPAPFSAGTVLASQQIVVFPVDAGGEPFPADIIASTLAIAVSYNWTATSVSQAFTSTAKIGIYTRNVSTLNLINSASMTYGVGAANTGNSSLFQGMRYITFASSQWSSTPEFKEGQKYFGAFQISTNATNWTASMSIMNAVSFATAFSRTMGGAGAPVASLGPHAPFRGRMTSSSALPATIQLSQMTQTGASGSVMPWIRIDEEMVY